MWSTMVNRTLFNLFQQSDHVYKLHRFYSHLSKNHSASSATASKLNYICCNTGYVLSCLPFMSEECLKIHEQIELIKNLKLTPDFIINIKVYLRSLFGVLLCIKKQVIFFKLLFFPSEI